MGSNQGAFWELLSPKSISAPELTMVEEEGGQQEELGEESWPVL